MSEEFLRIAKKEVLEDITEIGNLLNTCVNDADISKNTLEIEKHTHKLKGLAPMMGQNELGDIASILDVLLKLASSGKSIPEIFQTIKKSHQFMIDMINDAKPDYDSLKNELGQKYAAFLTLK